MLRGLQVLTLASLTVGAAAPSQTTEEPAHHAFVWTGDIAKTGVNFVVVVDADPASLTYGKLLTSVATDQKKRETPSYRI